MKIAIMQPYLFPYLGYFQLINAVDKFILFDDVNYIVKGWVNRNKILLNNEEYLFTIPCKKVSPNKLINEIEISIDKRFKSKLLKTFKRAYNKAPYFKDIMILVEETMNFNNQIVSYFNRKSITAVLNYLGIEKDITFSSNIDSCNSLKGEERIIKICRLENCGQYVNPIGGKKLYNKKKFKQNGINLSFIKTNSYKYEQLGNKFIPNLSIIDIMMFNSKEKINKMINNYTLI